MKSFFRLTVTACAAALLFSSCSKKNEEGKMIPKNALFVIHINTKSLKEKLTWDDIKQTSWYKKAYTSSTASDWMKKLMDNPENTGIDIDGGLLFFVEKNAGSDGELVLEGRVKSKKDFEQFNKNLDAAAVTRTEGDLNMLTLKGTGVVAWNDQHFVYTMGSPFPSRYGFGSGGGDMSEESNNTTIPAADKGAALSLVCKNLFSLKSDSSLEKNEKFTDLLHEKGDIHAWVNTEGIMQSSPKLGMLSMLKVNDIFKDNISTYTVSFDNGKIDIKHKGYAGKEFTDLMKKYKGGDINTDMITTIPSQDILGVLAMNFKPEGIKEILTLTGLDGPANSMAGKLGITIDDLIKANKGDIMLAVTDFKLKNDSMSYGPRPDVNVLFSAAIGDKASFQKVLDAAKKFMDQMGGSSDRIAYSQNDKVFAISNHKDFLDSYLAGNSKNKYDFLDKLKGHPIGIFIDIHKILSDVSASMKNENDPDAKLAMTESLNLWNNVYVTSGDIEKDAIVGSTEINFVNQNINSLKQLNSYIDALAKMAMTNRSMEEPTTRSDSAVAPVLAPPVADSATQ